MGRPVLYKRHFHDGLMMSIIFSFREQPSANAHRTPGVSAPLTSWQSVSLAKRRARVRVVPNHLPRYRRVEGLAEGLWDQGRAVPCRAAAGVTSSHETTSSLL